MRFFVAITGASGAIYGVRLVEKLLALRHEVFLCASKTGQDILKDEVFSSDAERELSYEELLSSCFAGSGEKPIVVRPDDFAVPFASGSNPPDGMAVVPCSMGVLGRIAAGVSSNLIERAADVCLKERKRLVLVTREAPFNLIHIRNMEKVTLAGAIVMPASPSFYHRPSTVEELVDFFVERVMSVMGVDGACTYKWGS